METVLDRLWSGIKLADEAEATTRVKPRIGTPRPAHLSDAELQARFFALKA